MNNIENKPFLQQVADDLCRRFPNGLQQVTVVFPNRRARLFLNDYLYQAYGHAVWEPQYADFSELSARPSGYMQADTIELVFHLYNALVEVFHERYNQVYSESFDEFYYFGETLLHDFDDVDQNLVDAKKLFTNLTELHDLDDKFTHLNEEQSALVAKFFKNLQSNETENSEIKRRFAEIWNILYDVYTRFRATLHQRGIAYPGMMARRTVERIQAHETADIFKSPVYVFVGFNVLARCEQEVFKALEDRALYYWDTDHYFLNDETVQEAGRFLRKDIQQFENALPKVESNLEGLSQVTIVDAPNDTAQAAYIQKWVKELNQTSFNTPDSAIVLCNEKLLGVTLRNIPETVDHVNITMGYPLAQTPICTFVQQLTEIALTFDKASDSIRLEPFLAWFDHAYTRTLFNTDPQEDSGVNCQLSTVNCSLNSITHSNLRASLTGSRRFKLPLNELNQHAPLQAFVALMRSTDSVAFLQALAQLLQLVAMRLKYPNDLQREALFRVVCIVNRLSQVQEGDITLELPITLRFIHRLMGSESIPYHGEPKEGLQVMGMLETRNMDFNNVLLLSVNEGLLPKVKSTASSFIPNLLRRAYDMSHTDHQDSLYAYHFYHLLQRAKNVTMVYCSGKEGGSKGEVSRFILQLLAEHPNKKAFRRIQLTPHMDLATVNPVAFSKDNDAVKEELNKLGQDKALSPTAINAYLDCHLKFYYQYILHLREEDELTDEVDPALMGNLFHRAMELCYLHIGQRNSMHELNDKPFRVDENSVKNILENEALINGIILKAYNRECFKRTDDDPQVPLADFSGEQRIYFSLIKEYVKRQLTLDIKETPFTMVGMEQTHHREITLDNGKTLKVGGIVDRLQQDDNKHWQLMDYKTSAKRQETKGVGEMFASNGKRAYHALQTLIYSWVLSGEGKEPVTPMLLYVNTFKENTQPSDTIVALNWKESNKDKATPIDNYALVADEFEAKLKETLEDIFDTSKPFVPNGNEKACNYCPFTTMCQRAVTLVEDEE